MNGIAYRQTHAYQIVSTQYQIVSHAIQLKSP